MTAGSHLGQLLDSHDRPLRLGGLLGRGGEGAVYEIADRSGLVAKILTKPDLERIAKLRVMTQVHSERLIKVAAWPVDLVQDRSGAPIGFLMPRIDDHLDIHLLYGPKTRLDTFPDAQWRFLVRAATNVARSFRLVHEHGLIIGDVNHGNLLVSHKATVRLIDCDSFQLTHGGRVFPCKVGVETHTPPELQGRDLSRVVRTPNHDVFGLAIVIFQLLFMGRHPFSGTYLDQGHMPIGQAIKEYRFAYGSRATAMRMQPPPFTLPLSAGSVHVASLFERAFTGTPSAPPKRPEAREWVSALEHLEQNLKTCTLNPSHQFVSEFSDCPWCSLELLARSKRIQIQWFNPSASPASRTGPRVDLDALWIQVDAVSGPGSLPPLPSVAHFTFQPSSDAVSEGKERKRSKIAVAGLSGGGAGLILLAVVGVTNTVSWLLIVVAGILALAAVQMHFRAPNIARVDAKARLDAAVFEASALRAQLQSLASDEQFVRVKTELQRDRHTYSTLDGHRQRKLNDLASKAERIQRQHYLERQRIWQARIPNVGSELTATLQSYGIETAADVSEAAVMTVPGFGPVRTAALLSWRQQVERNFRFNPNRLIDPADAAAVERETQMERVRIERALSTGAERLRLMAKQMQSERSRLMVDYKDALRRQAQAIADLAATG